MQQLAKSNMKKLRKILNGLKTCERTRRMKARKLLSFVSELLVDLFDCQILYMNTLMILQLRNRCDDV